MFVDICGYPFLVTRLDRPIKCVL